MTKNRRFSLWLQGFASLTRSVTRLPPLASTRPRFCRRRLFIAAQHRALSLAFEPLTAATLTRTIVFTVAVEIHATTTTREPTATT